MVSACDDQAKNTRTGAEESGPERTGLAWLQTCTLCPPPRPEPDFPSGRGLPCCFHPLPLSRKSRSSVKGGEAVGSSQTPTGAPPGAGDHRRDPSAGRQCRGWYPELPESPAASGPLSGLSAAGVSSPRKGLALSSPPSEASTPVDPGDRAQVGSFWGSGGWLRRGDSCHCRLQRMFSVPFPLALDVEVHWPGQGTVDQGEA